MSAKEKSTDKSHRLFVAIAEHARIRPEAAALITPEKALTWRELVQGINQVASALYNAGLQAGERCVIIAGNSIEHVLVMLGIARAGGVTTPMSLLLNGDTFERLSADAQPRFVFIDQAGRDCLLGRQLGESELIALDDKASFSRFLQSASDDLPPTPQPEDRFSIIYSSGTTGIPKGIVHSHSARCGYGAVFSSEYGIDRQSVVLLVTALYSNASWMLLLPAIFSGATLVMPGKYRPEEFSADIQKYQVTHAFLVPTQINDLLKTGKEGGVCALPPVVISAGSHLARELKRRILSEGNTRLFELYGNTEGVATILRPWQMCQGLETVGTAISGGEIAILGDEDQLLDRECEGEIIGRSPLMSSGYFQRDDLNAELFWQDQQGRVFVRSGDMGEINRDGMLLLRGRKKDMLVSGGINVYPVDIESVLLSHPDINEAAVIAKEHPRWGETPYAFVVLTKEAKINASELREWANQRLNKHQRIDALVVVDSLPRNALGKVVKSELKPLLAKEMADEE